MHLAIVGASVRAAACSALEAEHRVVAADLFADEDLAARCPTTRIDRWPLGLAKWLEAQQVDAWLYTGGLENYPDLVDRLSKVRPLLGNCGQPLRHCRNVQYLSRLMAAAEVPLPATRSTPPGDASSWLVKSTSSAGGLGVADWRGEPLPCKHYWQQRIFGRSISAAFAAADGEVAVLGVTEQLIGRTWTGARPYQYAGSIGPLAVEPSTLAQIERAGRAVVSGCGLVGLFGIDLVVDPTHRAWPVEVNPRYIASLEVVERATSLNAVAAHVLACIQGCVDRWEVAPQAGFHGKAYLFATADVTVPRLDPTRFADLPRPGTRIRRGQPICTVLAVADRYDEVEPALVATTRSLDEAVRAHG